MASKQMTMTDGPLARQIMAFSIPLMISNVLQVLFNMADIAVAGRFAGPEALGAVGSTTILVTLFIGIVIGMGSGVNVTVARFLGARQEKDVCESVHTSLILCLLVGLALAAVGVGGTHAIMTAMHTKPELIGGAERYLHIYFLGMPALGVYNFGNAVLSADGDTRHPLIFLSAAGVLNVVLNLFFVVVCQLGVTGVAIASVVPTILVILGSCVFRLIWIFTVFAHFQTIMSLYLLYIFSWTITAIAEIAYFVPCYRKQMALLK